MIFTVPQLKLIMPAAGGKVDRYYDPLHVSMEACDINNPKRAVNYLATVAHESGQLRYMAEIWGPNQVPVQKTYRNRMGNDKPEAISLAHAAGFSDPGQAFKGYGPIQVTGFDNQTEIADNFSIPHENMIKWFQSPEGAFNASAFFWMSHSLNQLADEDNLDDVLTELDAIQDIVNLGHKTVRIGDANGWVDRVMCYKRARLVLMEMS
jgi:putative chitinase